MASFKQEPGTWPYTPSSAVAAGDVVVLTDGIAVASRPIAANTLGAVEVEGVFTMPKAAEALALGAVVYWNTTNSNITATSAGGKRAGKVAAAAVSGDAMCWVDLNRG
jgi:predicted RecA/RadA family phage recombinase